MSSPSASAASSQLGKVDRWIIRYMIFCSFMFGATYIAEYCFKLNFEVRAASMIMASVVLLKAVTVPPGKRSLSGRATVILCLLFVVALFNSVVSWDMVESSLRWVFWFGIVICFARVVGASDGSWVEVAIQRLPSMFTLLYFTVIIVARYSANDDSLKLALHLSGLYGNLILACGLFATKLWQRSLWSLIGLIAIFFSGAGGALFTIPIMFIPYILYSASSMPVKGIFIAGLLMAGGLFFFQSQLFESFLNIKLNIATSEETNYSGLERLERSKEVRIQLVQYGFVLVEQHPLGTGLGHTYHDLISTEMGVPHVHNGTLTMLIELGFPGFAVVAVLMLWIFASILSSQLIDNQIKAFYFTYFFTIFGRSLSENYTPFDLGNFFNFVFLMFTIYLFLYQPSPNTARQFRGRPMHRPGPMMPPPRWAPPPPGARQPPQPMPVH